MLEIQEERATGEGAAVGAVAGSCDQRNVCKAAVSALRGAGTEANATGRRRRVVEKTSHAVEDVAAGEKATENLGIAAVNPFGAELPGVLTFNDGKIVADVGAIKEFVNGRLQEKWLAEAEVGSKAHGGVWNARGVDREARAGFAGIGEMGFVEHAVREGAEPIGADGFNLRRAFDAVGGGAIGRDVKGLIGVLGPVEVVGAEDLIFGIEVVVDATENGGVADRVIDSKPFIRVLDTRWERRGLEEVEKRDALAFRACANYRIIHTCDRRGHGAGWPERNA